MESAAPGGQLTGSGYYTQQYCSASSLMANQAKEQGKLPPQETDDTKRGVRCHTAMVSGDTTGLSEEEKKDVSIMQALAGRAEISFEEESQIGLGKAMVLREERLYLRDGLEPIYSGQPDVIFIRDGRAYFQDFKFSHGKEAWDYWYAQRRAYAVLIQAEFGCSDITGDIIPLHSDRSRISYNEPQLAWEKKKLLATIAEHRENNPKPTPGPWCTYCNGRLICPAACPPVDNPDFSLSLGFNSLPLGERGAEFVTRIKAWIPIANDILGWYEEQLTKNPNVLHGEWYLKKGRDWPNVIDNLRAIEDLSKHLTIEEQGQCITIRTGKVMSFLKAKHPTSNARVLLQKILGDNLEYKETKPTLEKK